MRRRRRRRRREEEEEEEKEEEVSISCKSRKKVLNNVRRTETSDSLTDSIRIEAKEEKLSPWNIQVTSSIASYILKEMGTREVNDYKQQSSLRLRP